MEKELRNLRKAMNSSTHKGNHFTDIQKKRIRASLHQQEIKVSRKPTISIYFTTAVAVSLFVFLFYTDLFTHLSSNEGAQQGSKQTLESEWDVRNEYARNGQELFSVFPDPNLSAGKPFGYMFHFKEPFAAYKGKEIEIYATPKGTGERIKVVPSTKITEPSPGYSSLDRFTASFILPEDGLWKYEVYFDKKLYGDVVLSVGDIPTFVKATDLDRIDWSRKAVNLGGNIIGNENKSGVIGADMPSINNGQKWMWHLWGTENPKQLTVVGYHREKGTFHQILTTGWSIGLGGPINGADAHMPSSVNIPMAGEWAILLYVDGELFDVLVYDIQH